MCNLTTKIKSKSRVGYKLVLRNKRTGKYYSSCMGFEYKENKDIPKIRVQKQKRGSGGFLWTNRILADCFKQDMVGRTSVFLSESDCRLSVIPYNLQVSSRYYFFVLVKARISKDIMRGSYGYGYNDGSVVAGKRIEFLQEIQVW